MLQAQQLPQFTQYLVNDYVTNPAIGGTKPYFEGKSNSRNQWVGINDAPRTYIFSLHGPIIDDKMGIGGYFYSDITGPTRRTGAQLSYSYIIKIKDGMNLSFGASGGLIQFVVDGGKITFDQDGDIALSNGIQSITKPDASAGAYLFGDNYFVSLAAPQVLGGKVDFFEDYDPDESELSRHFSLSAGYTYHIDDEFDVQPSFFAKYVFPVATVVDLSVRGIYKEQIWLGGSYRSVVGGEDKTLASDAIGIMAGYTFQKNLMVGYSYDIPMSNIKGFTTGSHELMLGIRFKGSSANNTPPAIE